MLTLSQRFRKTVPDALVSAVYRASRVSGHEFGWGSKPGLLPGLMVMFQDSGVHFLRAPESSNFSEGTCQLSLVHTDPQGPLCAPPPCRVLTYCLVRYR